MERFCRICMAMEKNKAFKSLFYDEPNFAEILFYVSEVVVFEVLGEPPALICRQCEIDLKTAARIKKLSLETDSFLKTMSSTVDLQLLTSIMNGEEKIKIKVEEDPDDIIGAFKGFEVDTSLIKLEVIDEFLQEEVEVPKQTIASGSNSKKSSKDKISEATAKQKHVAKRHRKTLHHCPAEGCTKSFWRPSDLHKHSFCHTDEKPISCPECGLALKSIYNLRSHMRVHLKENNFFCERCGKRFKTAGYLKRHVDTVHADPNLRYFCDLCGGDFKDKVSMRIHISSKHMQRYNRVCHICGKSLKKPDALRMHMRSIHKAAEKSFECPICQRKFMHKQKLKAHVECHGERPWPCDLCDKAFTKRYRLGEHYNKVHKIKMQLEKLSKHICMVCGKIFDQATSLKDHMRSSHDILDDSSI